MLHLQDVHTYYGNSYVLKGIFFEVKKGELATILGRNGAGKTTILRSIMGLAAARKGSILFDDKEMLGKKPHEIASLGVGYVPEERAIFPSLSVLENLMLPAKKKRDGLWNLEKIYNHFPRLRERSHNKGRQLSGGEQQMLAIARLLTMDVKLLLLDEPTEGLAPILVREIAGILQEIKRDGITMLLVEQNTKFASEVAERHHILYNGQIVYEGSDAQFRDDTEIQRRYLGV